MNPELEMNLLRRQNLGDSLRRSAQAAPDKPAIIFYTVDGASQTCSYAQLNTMVNAVANNLQRRGVKKGDRVAALSRNDIPFLALGYALHKIGAWLVPVNFMLQPHDVQHLIEFAEAKWFFVEDALLGNVDAVLGKLADASSSSSSSALSGTPPRKGWIAFDALARRTGGANPKSASRARMWPRCSSPAAPSRRRRACCPATPTSTRRT